MIVVQIHHFIKAIGFVDMFNHINLQPIELTPEILEAAGFEKRLINSTFYEYYKECTPPNYKKNAAYKLRYWDADKYRRIEWLPVDSGTIHSFPCKYLHHLQNLYFALTGEELTIKEIAPTQ